MPKSIKVYITPEDRESIDRLMKAYDNSSVACLVRIAIDRCMVRFPAGAKVPRTFVKKVERAEEMLNPNTVTEGTPAAIGVGNVYCEYVSVMHKDLGFSDRGKMVRGLVLLWSNGDL